MSKEITEKKYYRVGEELIPRYAKTADVFLKK